MEIKELFRVEHVDLGSLWYNYEGVQTNQLFDILDSDSPLYSLDMGFEEIRRKDPGKWLSSSDSLSNLKHWFNKEDFYKLMNSGYKLYKYRVKDFKPLENKEFIFREETTVDKLLLNPNEMYLI